MLRSILPSSVVVAETRSDHQCALHPAEVRYLEAVGEARAREFATVRWCAGIALAGLGLERGVMTPGHCGSPRWPTGVVGSMSHCPGYRAACVTWASDEVVGLGIDVEAGTRLSAEVVDTVATYDEQARMREMRGGADRWAKVLFSAKESVYKACYPITDEVWDYRDVELTIRGTGEFTARTDLDNDVRYSHTVIDGRWSVSSDIVFTSAIVRSRATPTG